MMYCPKCKKNHDVVIDSRLRVEKMASEKGIPLPRLIKTDKCYVARRRKCLECGTRWTTHERIVPFKFQIKNDIKADFLLNLDNLNKAITSFQQILSKQQSELPDNVIFTKREKSQRVIRSLEGGE